MGGTASPWRGPIWELHQQLPRGYYAFGSRMPMAELLVVWYLLCAPRNFGCVSSLSGLRFGTCR